MKKMVVPLAVVSYSQMHNEVVRSKKNNVKGEVNKTKKNLESLELQIANRYSFFEQSVSRDELFEFP